MINYDFPMTIEDYVHRVGRTGRAGESGTAITFFTKANGRLAKDLIQVLRESDQLIPQELYSFKTKASEKGHDNRYNRFGWNSGSNYGRRYGDNFFSGYSGRDRPRYDDKRRSSRSPRRY